MLEIPIKVNVTKEQAQRAIEDFVNGARSDLNDIIGPGGYNIDVNTEFTSTGAKEVSAEYSKLKTDASKYESQLIKNSRTQAGSVTSLRQTVNALKQQRDALNRTNPAWADYNKRIGEAQDKLRAASGVQKGSLTDLKRQRDELLRLRDAVNRFPTGPGGKAAGPTWNQLNKEIKQLNGEINRATPGFNQFFSVLSKVSTIQAGFVAITAAVQSVGSAVNAYVSRIKQLEGFTLALQNIGLSAAETNGYLRQSREIATDLGAPIQQVEKGFKRMLPALQAVGTSSADSSRFVEALTARTQTLGLSTDESGRLFEAFAQVLSKGKLQAEELNQQISELDGAFRTQLADAIGVSTEQLTELVEEGAITAPVFVEAFLKMENGVEALQKRIESGNATIQQLQNNIANINVQNLEAIGRAIEPGIKSFLALANSIAKFAQEFVKTEQFRTLTIIFNQVAKTLENLVKGFLAATKVVLQITEPIFRVLNAVLGLGREFGGLIGIITTLVAAFAGLRLIQVIGGYIDSASSRFTKFRRETILAAAATEKFKNTAGGTTFGNIARQALIAGEGFKRLGQSAVNAGAKLLGFNVKAKETVSASRAIETASKGVQTATQAVGTGVGQSIQQLDLFGPKVAESAQQLELFNQSNTKSAKSTGTFSRSAQIASKYSLDFGRALGWSAGESAKFLRLAKQKGPVTYGLAKAFASAAGGVAKFGDILKTIGGGLTRFGGQARGAQDATAGIGRSAQISAKYNLDFGKVLGWTAGESAKFLRTAKQQGPVQYGLARAFATTTGAVGKFGQGLRGAGTQLGALATRARAAGASLAKSLAGSLRDIVNPVSLGIMAIGNLIQIWNASGQAASDVKAQYAEPLDTLKQGYEKATQAAKKQGTEGTAAAVKPVEALKQQNQAAGNAGKGWTALTIGLGVAAVAATVLTGGLGGIAIGAALATGAALTTNKAVQQLQKSAAGKQWLESTKEFNIQLQQNNQKIRDLNVGFGSLDFSKFAEGSTNLQQIGGLLLANYSATKGQIAANEELIKSELAKAEPNQAAIAAAREENASLQQKLVTQKLLLDAYNAEIAARVRKGQAVDYEKMSLEELQGLQEAAIQQVEKLREVQNAAVTGFTELQSNLMGLGTAGVAAMVSTIDAIAERELEGLGKTDVRRKAIIQAQLEAQLKQNAFEERIGQLRLKLQNQVAINEAKVQQARFQAEAKIAAARGDMDLAKAYNEAAQAQGGIIKGLQVQYQIESGVLKLQKEAKDQALLTKGEQEGISQAVFDRYGVEKKGISDVSGQLDGYIAQVEGLATEYGNAATNAGEIATSMEVEGIKNSVKPIEEFTKKLETAKKDLGQATADAQKMAGYTGDASSGARGFADNMNVAATNAGKARQEVEKIANVIKSTGGSAGASSGRSNFPGGSRRALGGPVAAGGQYFVNDGGGREGFLSASGKFSMLPAARNINWRAPSSGFVIPAHLVDSYKQNSVVNNEIKNINQRSVTRQTIDPNLLAGASSGNLSKRNGSAMPGSTSSQRITNNITIQSQQPVMDASKIMANVSRMRARRRPF